MDFSVAFDENVTGADPGDVVLTATGVSAGASIINVADTGATRSVTVITGARTGVIRLDVVDDNSIVDSDTNPLGGAAVGDGDFNAGEEFTIVDATQLVAIPTLDARALLLAVLLAGAAVLAIRPSSSPRIRRHAAAVMAGVFFLSACCCTECILVP